MKYKEGELLIRIVDLDRTAGELGLDSLDKLQTVDVMQHVNRLTALLEDIGIAFDDLQVFYDDFTIQLRDEYRQLPLADQYPVLTLVEYDRWFREILEAVQIAHTIYHDQQLERLRALETSAGVFINSVIRAGD
ncbi:MAG: hypothetical protein ABIA75_05570 [Candidatus Neomarinimicrobiota bacterium]